MTIVFFKAPEKSMVSHEAWHAIQTAYSKIVKYLFILCGKHTGVIEVHVIEGFSWDTENLQAGVPNGSTLGLMIFFIYINDLVEEVNSKMRLYTDDMSHYLDYYDP